MTEKYRITIVDNALKRYHLDTWYSSESGGSLVIDCVEDILRKNGQRWTVWECLHSH